MNQHVNRFKLDLLFSVLFCLCALSAVPAAAVCDVPADCDDGRFCNGLETCVWGICTPLVGTEPCPGEHCDELIDVCQPPACNDDGLCGEAEDCNVCPGDCIGGLAPAQCGDGVCQTGAGENCRDCPADCNGLLQGKRSERFCCGDADAFPPVGCNDLRCVRDGFSCNEGTDAPYCCGDGLCEGPETALNCSVDCTTGTPGSCLSGGSLCASHSQCCSNKCTGGTCRGGIVDET